MPSFMPLSTQQSNSLSSEDTAPMDISSRIAHLETQMVAANNEMDTATRSTFYLLQMAYREHESLTARIKELETENFRLRAAVAAGGGRLAESGAHQSQNQVNISNINSESKAPAYARTSEQMAYDQPPILDLDFRGTKTTHDLISTDYDDFVKSTTQTQNGQPNGIKVSGNRQAEDSKLVSLGPEHESAGALEARIFKHYNPTALGIRSQQFTELPDFYQYGIRYNPPQTLTGTWHRVLISKPPPKISIADVMGKIRGGAVVPCSLCDTSSITGSWSALVRFTTEEGAMAFDDNAAASSLIFGKMKAMTKIINTASYPLSRSLQEDIFASGRTRCLDVLDLPQAVGVAGLKEELRGDTLETMEMRENGTVQIRFTSILEAGKAFKMFSTWRVYSECSVSFASDPCALSVSMPNGLHKRLSKPLGDSDVVNATNTLAHSDHAPKESNILGT